MNHQARGNPNKVVIDSPIDAPGKVLTWYAKQVEVKRGGQCAGLVVIDGSLKLSDQLAVGHVVVANPTGGDGAADNGVYLQGATGEIGTIQTLGCQRDHGKVGSGTHDLLIGSWIGGCAPPLVPAEGDAPVHRDGVQVSSAERVTIRRFWLANQYPGATNGGIWCNPQKSGNPDANDPTLVQDVVLEFAWILFPNAAIHLGACTRCGARDSTLIAQRPVRTDDRTVDAVDERNDKQQIEGLAGGTTG